MEEGKFKPLEANPDEIAEFVSTLKPEELKTNLLWALLKVREINLHNQNLQSINTKAIDALEEINRRANEAKQ